MSERKCGMTQATDPSVVVWRKSSYSGANGECIEVATWRKSSHSGGNGNCIEVAASAREVAAAEVAVRDSTDPSGPRLTFPPAAWRTFAATLK
jgi:Domain of unknown function (DUF397)